MAVAEELGDDGGADQAGATGDEDVHGTLPESDGTLVSRHYQGDGTQVPSPRMGPWLGGNQGRANGSS